MKCCLTLTATGLLFASVAAEPQWVFNHGPDAKRAVLTCGAVSEALGLFRLDATGSDLTLSVPYAKKDAFSAAERPFLAVRYRIRSRFGQCGVFFATDTLTSLSDKSYSHFKIVPDGAWHNAVVDMRVQKPTEWKGTVREFRIDPTNPSDAGDTDEISRLGFFPSREAAEAFLAQADDREDYSLDLFLRGERYRAIVPGGCLAKGWKEADYRLKDARPPAGEGALSVTCDGEPVPCQVNGAGFAFYVAEKPGDYRLVRGLDAAKRRPLDKAMSEKLGCGISEKANPASYFSRERIRIGGWGLLSSAGWDRRYVNDFAACGLDFLVGGGRDSGSDAGKLLTACDEEGIEVILQSDPKGAAEFADHPSFCGHYLTDEPGTDAYDYWGKKARECVELTGRRPFINLLPMYANAAQLKFGAGAAAIEYYDADPNLFRKYCEAYCDKVPTDYICTDIYPLHWIKGRAVTYRDYIESINVIASVARERNREFWCCIQTFGWNAGKRTPNAAEYRWQCYSLLSFGCRNLLCWVYVPRTHEFPSLVTCEGERTAAWYDAREVFREIKAISDVYCSYRNVGAFTHNCTKATPYLKMSGELRDFPAIRSVKCAAPLLFGCFAAKQGGGSAFTVVNMNDFEAARSALVKLDLAADSATVYRRGVPETVTRGPDGLFDLPLECGEGVFVTVSTQTKVTVDKSGTKRMVPHRPGAPVPYVAEIGAGESWCVAEHMDGCPGTVEAMVSAEIRAEKRDFGGQAVQKAGPLELRTSGLASGVRRLSVSEGTLRFVAPQEKEVALGPNLVQNPGFEQGGKGWRRHVEPSDTDFAMQRASPNFTYATDSWAFGCSAHEGDACLRVHNNSGAKTSVSIPTAGVYRVTLFARPRSDSRRVNPLRVALVAADGTAVDVFRGAIPMTQCFLGQSWTVGVAKPGAYDLVITGVGLPTGWLKDDKGRVRADDSVLVDGVSLVRVQPAKPMGSVLGARVAVSVADGATLALDEAATNDVASLCLGGREVAGCVSAKTHPGFLAGAGTIRVLPAKPYQISLKKEMK